MLDIKFNHKKIYQDFIDKSNIIELYEAIKPAEIPSPKRQNTGKYLGHAFWRGDKTPSLLLVPNENLAYDFADAKCYNVYSMAMEALGSKEASYIAMAQVARLDLDTYVWKETKTTQQDTKTEPQLKLQDLDLPKFYPLSEANKDLIKKYRGIDYSELSSSQKSNVVQDEKGKICLLYKYKGQTRFFQKWLPDSEMKYMSGKGITPKETYSLGGLNTLQLPHNNQKQDLYIVEGFFDMICMQLSGFNCITKYNAKAYSDLVATWIKENAKFFDNIYLALDNDEMGQEGISDIIQELGEEIKELKISKAILKKPEGQKKLDANDIFRERVITKEDFIYSKIDLPRQEKPVDWDEDCLDLVRIAKTPKLDIVANSYELPIAKQAMTLICALSGHGKTTALLNLSVDIAKQKNQQKEEQNILYVLLEETPLIIVAKMQSIYLNKHTPEITKDKSKFDLVGFHIKLMKQNFGEFEEGDEPIKVSPDLMNNYRLFENMFFTRKIVISDASEKNVDEIVASVKRIFTKRYFDTVLIDYIQKVKSSPDMSKHSRQVQLASISSKLARLAVDLNTAVIVGAQLRRDVNGVDQLDLSNIREAGDIGQDAHLAIGIWNYSDNTKNIGAQCKKEVVLRCLKHRGSRFDDLHLDINFLTWSQKSPTLPYKSLQKSD